MKIQVLTPTGKVFEGDCSSVKVPGTGGQFQILQNHAALLSSLEPGNIEIRLQDGSNKTFTILSGFVEVLKNDIALLVNLAEA
jgi:F-type H+-transporting ATPase subunit epsilon